MEGPQLDMPMGATPNSHPGGVSGWNGMTIKDILEKVDLFNITSLVDDDYQKVKDTKPPFTMSDTKVIIKNLNKNYHLFSRMIIL